jgi:uncharacterized membrane protein (UPF0127 family)
MPPAIRIITLLNCLTRSIYPVSTGIVSLALIASATCCGGCDAPKPRSSLPTTSMRIGSRTFTLEIAADETARNYGLMRRDSMPRDHGMIFVFEDELPRSFWMKDTRIPLDILFIAADGRVVSIKQMQPYDQRNTPSDGPAQFAIELNEGAAPAAGVKVGDRLNIPPEARKVH